MARLYLNNRYTPENEIYWDFVCLTMASVSKWCVIPMQDYLGLDNSARMNTPSTVSVNRKWRLSKSAFDKSLVILLMQWSLWNTILKFSRVILKKMKV